MANMNSFETAKDSNQELDTAVKASTNIIYLKIGAFALPLMYLLSIVPTIGVAGYWGFLVLLIVLPLLTIIWWIRHGSIQTDDPFFKKAKRSTIPPLVVWGFMLTVWTLAPVIYRHYYFRRPIQKAEDQLQNLPRYTDDKYYDTVIVIRDSDDVYWAFKLQYISQINKNKITVKKHYFVYRLTTSGEATPEEVGNCLASGYVWKSNQGRLLSFNCSFGEARRKFGRLLSFSSSSGEARRELTPEDVEVEVKEVVLSKVPE